MAWVFFQVMLAFGVAVAIVWWTWPKTPKAVSKTERDAVEENKEREPPA